MKEMVGTVTGRKKEKQKESREGDEFTFVARGSFDDDGTPGRVRGRVGDGSRG